MTATIPHSEGVSEDYVCPYIEYGSFPSNIYDQCNEYFVESPRQRNQEFGCCTDALLHVCVF